MSLTPRLPAGFHAQPTFHHQEGWTGFDFYRVYDTERAHDELRSFWLVTHSEDTRGPMPPSSRWLSFSDWAHATHRPASDYHVFANPQTKIPELRKWLEANQSGDLVEIREV